VVRAARHYTGEFCHKNKTQGLSENPSFARVLAQKLGANISWNTRMSNKQKQCGKLVIIGGAEDREDDRQILREFVRLAGGRNAVISVLTAATNEPEAAGQTYCDVFYDLGAKDVYVADTRQPEDANRPEIVRAIANSTGIFFTGGDQARITACLINTILEDAIRKRFEDGAAIAGTSAGAAIMPNTMIVEGDSETNPRINAVKMGPGMGFLPGVVIDQHFAQRGRLGRLLSALLIEPSVLGFGIDENTAMVVDGEMVEIIGEGAVTVVDESSATYNNLDQVLQDEPVAVFGTKLHVLPHGYRFNLKTRQPLRPENHK
jgi:cyanophycinase